MLYGLAILLGCYLSLDFTPFLFIPITLLSFPLFIQFSRTKPFILRICFAYSLLFMFFIYLEMSYHFPDKSIENIEGIADIEISSLTSSTTHYGNKWIYRGKILNFFPNDPSSKNTIKNIPFTLSLPQKNKTDHPPANRSYRIPCVLKKTKRGNYALIAKKNAPWYEIENSWSFAELRHLSKQYVKNVIQQAFGKSRVSIFLSGIATGEFDDRLMSFEFARFGLQHIMAISGFHFVIVSGILSLLFRFIFSQKKTIVLLSFLLTSYFIFLGSNPSIIRAWLAILIVLGHHFIKRSGSGLNSLGVGLIVILLFDPMMCQNIGFQFSFLTTASILLFFPGINSFLQSIFRKRILNEAIRMNRLNQYGYCVLSLFRQALSLGIAVNLAAFPMALFLFHKFPWLSLVYNLFFPFMVSLSMLLLLLGFFLQIFFPFLGEFCHKLNSIYTQFILNFTHNMPPLLNLDLQISYFPKEILICYLCAIICLSIFFNGMRENKLEED